MTSRPDWLDEETAARLRDLQEHLAAVPEGPYDPVSPVPDPGEGGPRPEPRRWAYPLGGLPPARPGTKQATRTPAETPHNGKGSSPGPESTE